MRVVFLEDVSGVANGGDIKEVKNGFARNFLLPRGKALIANDRNRARFAAERDIIEKRNADARAEAQQTGDSLDGSGKDAEVITIWLDRLPAEVEYFAFVVSRHAGGGFQDAVGARVELRSVSKAPGGGGSVAVITSQDLRKIQPGSDTLIFAVVHRSYSAPAPAGPPGGDVSAGEWQAKEVLQLAQGRNFQECKVSTTACVVSPGCHVCSHTDAL